MMRIKSIEVKNLFGTFDHSIRLNLHERITIIHGPNGIGKTVLFRLLKSLLSGSYRDLRTIPYDSFSVVFEDGSYINVLKRRMDAQEQLEFPEVETVHRTYLNVEYFVPGQDEASFILSRPEECRSARQARRIISEVAPWLTRINLYEWRNDETYEIMDIEDVMKRYSHFLPGDMKKEQVEPDQFTRLRKSVDVHLIDTHRLLDLVSNEGSSETSKTIDTVSKYSKQLTETLKQQLGLYADLSQLLDRSFPRRLIDAIDATKPPSINLDERLLDLDTKRKKLVEAGLLVEDSSEILSVNPEHMDDSTTRVLEIYIADVEKKLSVFDDISARIDAFKGIVNERFQNKSVVVSREHGFRFQSDKNSNDFLSPNQLSSGEQHEIVLFYELLFKIRSNSLILIDEPELSLHVAWQLTFLKDLNRVTNLTNVDVLIATHSPQIINDRWDLTVELRGRE